MNQQPMPPSGPVDEQLGLAMASLGVGGVVSMPRSMRDQISAPVVSGNDYIPPMSALCSEFRSEKDQSAIKRADRERVWQISMANYVQELLAKSDDPAKTSTAFYSRFGQILDDFQSDLLRMIDPKAEYTFDTRCIGPDNKVDTEISDKLKMSIKRILDRCDWSCLLRDVANDAAFFGEFFVHGPISKPPTETDFVLLENGTITEDPADDAAWFEHLPVLDVYPDAGARRPRQCGHFNIRRIYKTHELEKMAASGDPCVNKRGIEETLKDTSQWSPAGWWDTESTGDGQYVVWQRIGFLTGKQTKELREHGLIPALKAGEKEPLRAVWDILYTEKNEIIRVAMRKSSPGKLPVYMGRVRRVPGNLHGLSIMENTHSLVDVLNNLFREIDNQTQDLSGVNVVVDPAAIEGNDFSVRGRKTWIRRRSTILPDQQLPDPVRFLPVPNNLGQLVSTLEAIEIRLERVVGLPSYAMSPKESLGSGIRTIGQQEQLWESAQRFIRLVVGNFDEELIEPVIRSLVPLAIGELAEELAQAGIAKIHVVAQGVQGAIRREIVGRRFIQMYTELANAQKLDRINEPRAIKLLTEFSGLQDENLAMSDQEYLEEMRKRLAEKVLAERNTALATETVKAEVDNRHRAQSAVVDVMLQQFKALPPNDPTGPVLQEQIMELTGKASPRLYAALAIKTRMIAGLAAQAGAVTPEEQAIYSQPYAPESSTELEPGSDPSAPPPPANSKEAMQDNLGQVRDFNNTPTPVANGEQLPAGEIPMEQM